MPSLPSYSSLESIRETGLPVVIFGAGSSGEALYYASREQGIQVAAFADTNTSNISRVNGQLCGLPVIFTDDLPSYFENAAFLISANYIGDFVRDLAQLGYQTWFPGGKLLEGFNLLKGSYTRDISHVRHSVEAAIDSHAAYLDPTLLYVRSVDILITEKCSMKCQDCSNLMQFYADPQNFGVRETMEWVDQLCERVDLVGEARVIGGEPFMNKDAAAIIRHCAEKPQFRRVTVFTNGTIPLTQAQLELMRHEKIVFLITEYEGFMKNNSRIKQSLEESGIRCVSQPARGWTDCGHILPKQNRSREAQTEFFRTCCGNKLFTLSPSDGKLYRCPFAANAAHLRAIPDDSADYVMANADREAIAAYMGDNLAFIPACDYCPGRRLDDPEITPGIQVRKPIEYVQITG